MKNIRSRSVVLEKYLSCGYWIYYMFYQFSYDKHDENDTHISKRLVMCGLGIYAKLQKYVANMFYAY